MKPNPALSALGFLAGTWTTAGHHPLMPGVALHGRASFEWIENRAFLMMRTEMDDPRIPSAVAIFASDDATGECFMLYYDSRGVSRKYDVSMRDNVLSWWRNSADFSQRFTAALSADGRTMEGRGEMSRDGGPWEPDLQLTYTRD